MTAATIVKYACSLEENRDKPRHHIKKQRHHFGTKVMYSESNGFSSSYGTVRPYRRLNTEELMLSTVLKSSLDSKEIKPVNPKGNQS